MIEGARPATAADVARIVELAELMHAELRSVRGGEMWEVNEARPLDVSTYASLVDAPDAIVLVGTIDDTIIGFTTVEIVALRDNSKLGSIRELFVEEGARAVSVGECLINEVLDRLRAVGCRAVDAFALPGHRAAKNFFEEQGLTARLIVMHRAL
jgi:GNAT superfamily N-acetyltransferase